MPGRPASAQDESSSHDARGVSKKVELNFEELVQKTYKSSLVLAVRLVGNLEDASDVIQEAYLKAYRAIGQFRGDAQLETWLYRIVSNTATTFRERRVRHRTEVFTDELEQSSEFHSSEGDTRASNRIDLERALAKLPKGFKTVVVLKDLYGLSHREIAERLSITEATAKVWLHRGRKRLTEIVSDADSEIYEDGSDTAA